MGPNYNDKCPETHRVDRLREGDVKTVMWSQGKLVTTRS